MPYTVRLLDDGLGILAQGSGKVTLAEVERAKREFASSGKPSSPRSYLLIDLTEATEFGISGAEVQVAAGSTIRLSASMILPGSRAAVIAPTDVAFGVARMWEVFVDASGMETQVFRSRVAAELWVKAAKVEGGPIDSRL